MENKDHLEEEIIYKLKLLDNKIFITDPNGNKKLKEPRIPGDRDELLILVKKYFLEK